MVEEMENFGASGGRGATALPDRSLSGGRGATALPDRPLPVRKRLDHRGPLSIDVTSAWYFITICAEGHTAWMMTKSPDGRAVAPRPPQFDDIAVVIMREARENHERDLWRLALFLVMPDHLHFIVHVPTEGGGRGATALPRIVNNFKHLLSVRYGLRFQRDFFDTRLRDDAHYAEKFRYVCNNPVRKGLCERAQDWPYVMVFERNLCQETDAGNHAISFVSE